MIKEHNYICKGTCSSSIKLSVDTETNKLHDIEIIGGCNGNLKGIRSLIIGMDIDDIINKLLGTKCRSKNTSCPDQIAKALLELKEEK